MIVRKIARKVTERSEANERHYVVTLGRYIIRAVAEDVRALAELSDDSYIQDLARYVARHGQAEQVRAAGAMNLLGSDLAEWNAELHALSFRATNPENATDHWVLSWAEQDQPTDAEILEATRIFLKCEGLQDCPTIWGIHSDTNNVHVHLMITRIDPITSKRVEAGQGWDLDTAHRAKAVIEDRFPRFEREAGSAYTVIDARLIDVRTKTDIGPADDPSKWRRVRSRDGETALDGADTKVDIEKRLDEKSRTCERDTGLKSHTRVALEEAVPILLASKSWAEAHRELSEIGISLTKERKGGLLHLGDTPVKLSVDRRTSYPKLAKRFGEFQEADGPPAPYAPRELHERGSPEAAYFAEKRAFLARLNNVATSLRAVEASRGVGASLSRMSRSDLFSVATFPSFAAWQRGAAPLDPADFLTTATGDLSFVVGPLSNERPKPFDDIPGLIGLRRGNLVIYRRIDDVATPPPIIDTGSLLLIHEPNDEQVVRATLVIAARKWPGQELVIQGGPEFQAIAHALARELGLKIEVMGQSDAVAHSSPDVAPPTSKAVPDEPAAIEMHAKPPVPAPSPAPSHVVVEVTQPVPEQNNDFDRWKVLMRKREDRLERERLAFVIAQNETLMAQVEREGFRPRILEDAQARREWLARQGASHARGRG